MPKTVRDFIYYYYAKLVIAPSAGEAGNYRFIMDRYRRLKNGEIQMSDYDREIQRLAQTPGLCVFCAARGHTVPMEVVPLALGGPVGIHNLVHACTSCDTSRQGLDLLSWWCGKLGRDKDDLPPIPAGLFLKLAHERHTVAFTLASRCADIASLWPRASGEAGRRAPSPSRRR
ncbi:MAG: hypothetical protein HYY76_16310 [Acidobacteria bacterium]|nr:hypothetical protein [Acidobacteriota bacterium]